MNDYFGGEAFGTADLSGYSGDRASGAFARVRAGDHLPVLCVGAPPQTSRKAAGHAGGFADGAEDPRPLLGELHRAEQRLRNGLRL